MKSQRGERVIDGYAHTGFAALLPILSSKLSSNILGVLADEVVQRGLNDK